jgi:hypothetical protein
VRTHIWLNLAAFCLVEPSEQKAAVAARDEIAKLMIPAQIAEVQRLAREWKPTRP